MTGEGLAVQAELWKQELLEEVIPYYRQGNRQRGQIAFLRWKERVISGLESNAPAEASAFRQWTTREGISFATFGESDFDIFMRDDGDDCIAFLEDLADNARRGRIALSPPLNAYAATTRGQLSRAEQSNPMGRDEAKKNREESFDLSRLWQILASLFPDRADARRLIDEATIANLGINLDENPINRWHGIVNEAQRQSKLLSLLSAVHRQYPDYDELMPYYLQLGVCETS